MEKKDIKLTKVIACAHNSNNMQGGNNRTTPALTAEQIAKLAKELFKTKK